jgi:hypothetical protein
MAKSRSLREFASDVNERLKEEGSKVRRHMGRHAFQNPVGDKVSIEGAEMMVEAGGKAARLRKEREAREKAREEEDQD